MPQVSHKVCCPIVLVFSFNALRIPSFSELEIPKINVTQEGGQQFFTFHGDGVPEVNLYVDTFLEEGHEGGILSLFEGWCDKAAKSWGKVHQSTVMCGVSVR
jgi:hypothetical protein